MTNDYAKRSRIARYINTVTAVFLATILMVMIANAALTRHPWAITCYNCKACNLKCPLGLDPSGYVTAALTANPDYMMYATKVRISLEEALQVDPGMIINHRGRLLTAQKALFELVLPRKTEVRVYKMRAKDAAKYDLLCGNCQKTCPINLPIEEIIRDLRKNGRFESFKGIGGRS
jgi:ferredoxin